MRCFLCTCCDSNRDIKYTLLDGRSVHLKNLDMRLEHVYFIRDDQIVMKEQSLSEVVPPPFIVIAKFSKWDGYDQIDIDLDNNYKWVL